MATTTKVKETMVTETRLAGTTGTIVTASLMVAGWGFLIPHLQQELRKNSKDCTNVQDICIGCKFGNQRDYLDFWKSLDHRPTAMPLQCLREGKREQVMFLTTQASLDG